MTAFMTLLEEDLMAMLRSWTVWMWLAINSVGGLSVVIFAGSFDQESTPSYWAGSCCCTWPCGASWL